MYLNFQFHFPCLPIFQSEVRTVEVDDTRVDDSDDCLLLVPSQIPSPILMFQEDI